MPRCAATAVLFLAPSAPVPCVPPALARRAARVGRRAVWRVSPATVRRCKTTTETTTTTTIRSAASPEQTPPASDERKPIPLSTRVGGLLSKLSDSFTTLFPVWTVVASVIALWHPAWFATRISPQMVTLALSGLMLSTGLTLTLSDLRGSLRRPALLAFGFAACYGLMPLFALLLARVFALPPGPRAGLLLLGAMSGGQASNLCTYIARGDTALSVAMTTVTTLCAAAVLPLLSEVLLGTAVALDSGALARSTAQIVLLPIALGALANRVAAGAVRRIRPALPVAGIAMLLVLIVGPVAKTAAVIRGGSLAALAAPVALLHVMGGVAGYVIPRLAGASHRTAVTTAFETGFKSPALSFVLASKHFADAAIRVPSAVSIIVLAPLAALFAVVLRAGRGGGGGGERESVRAEAE